MTRCQGLWRAWPMPGILILVLVLVTGRTVAQEGAVPSLRNSILRVDVPADRPDVWFGEARSLIAVPREEFEQLLKESEPSPPGPRPVQITSARYTATLAGQALRDGRGQLTVQRVGEDPVLLPLGEFNVAVRDFSWTDREAVWGSDRAGQSWLKVDTPSGDLQWSWSAAGRLFAGELNFDLQFPAAAISTLDLRVPRDQAVRSLPEARRVEEGSDAQWQVWRIQLGSDRRCRLAVMRAEPAATRSPTILYDYELGAVVREQDLRFQSVFQVEVFDAPATELTFTVPASVDVYAVTYGQDLPLTWTRPSRSESAGTIQVKLPGPLLGRGRPIRIDGVAVQKPSSMISPQITIKDGVFVGGRHTLNIVAPLQLRSFRPTGFRQLTPATSSGSGENYTFLQLLPDAQLVLDVGRPQASLTAQVHSLFEMTESTWTLTSELTWTASSGGVFRTECQFPADWEITDVRLASELGTARLAGWDVGPASGGVAVLRVEFLEALAPTVPRTLRVLARRRPLGTGQAFSLPLPHPTNCYSVESLLGLIVPSAFSPFVSEDARLERVSPPEESSPWVIRPVELAANQSEYWYRREATDGGGTLQLVSRLRRVVASSETRIQASAAEFQEYYQIKCQPEGAPIDRLVVYLTQPGPDVRWSTLAPRQGELVAQRLPIAQHADWNCPATGELWELRLPPLPGGPIQIVGRRANRWQPLSRPALLVVPQATDRRSSVLLRYPADLDLRVEGVSLDRLAAGADDFDPPSAAGAVLNERSESWSFDNAAAKLELTLRNPERSREFPTMVSMRLRSLLSANPQGFDLYRAQLRLENGTARDQLRIRLPASAILQQVNVGGQATVPNRQDEVLLVSDLDATQHEVVELLYRVPSYGGDIRDVHRIVVPQVSATVLGFAWEFALPPSVRIHAEPTGVRLTRPLPQPTWTERMFGPLGRPADEPFFNPLALESWQELIRPTLVTESAPGDLGRDLIAPADWQVHEGIAATVPTEIRLETWRSRETRLASWITLLVTLILGIVLRKIGWRHRDRTAAYWLAVTCSLACFVSSPFAEMIGGAIAGTVMALLFPRRSVIMPRRDASNQVPLGSTRSFDWGATAGILLAVAASATVLGQENPAPVTNAPAAPHLILVPVDQTGSPSSELPVVYVPKPLLTQLRAAAQARSPVPEWLIASADYHVTATAGGSDSMVAKFRVHLLTDDADSQIELPVSNAFLTGTEACRVNGVPFPAEIASGNRGFLVNWRSREPGAGPLEIELDLKRVGVRTALGGSIVASVPGVASSRWIVELPESTSHMEIEGARGATKISSDQRHFDVDAGSTGSLELRWSQNPPDPRPLKIDVAQFQVLDLRSTHGELRFRYRVSPQESSLDVLDFDLPPRCVVRDGDIRSPGLLRTEVFPVAQGGQRLRLTFTEPQSEKFTIDGTLLIVAAEGISHLQLPKFGLSRSPEVRVTTLQNWWAVGTPLEYRLEHQNLEADLAAGLTAAEFLQAWGESPPTGRLQVVFQPRENSAVQFTVTPQVPRRRVLSWTQTGVVGRRRVEWTLTARLETSQAPVYQHFLLVDRRLQIESISVVEGGAERRDRWYENRSGTSPTRVVVFLSDKTSGVQQLIVKASMPTRYGRPLPLPFIRCEEAELGESRWELYHDPEVEVDVQAPRGTPPFVPEVGPTPETGPELIARYQTTDPDPRASIRVSAVQARCTARTVAALTRGEGATWSLSGQLMLKPEGDSPRRMGVVFPESIDPDRVLVDRADASWHEPVDGLRRLDLTLMPDPDEVLISFETSVVEPAQGDWQLPLPEPQESASHQVHVRVAPADEWTPLEGTELKPDESPAWAVEVLDKFRTDQVAAEYQLARVPLSLRRSATPSDADQPEIRLLDHCLWFADAECVGITRAYLSQTRDAIEFAVPSGLQPIAVFLDERPLSLPAVSDQKLMIPLIGGARESVLTVTWTLPQSRGNQLVRLSHEELPHPVSLDPERTLVTVVPHPGDVAVARNREQNLLWMDAALDRLEMLIARQESLGTDPRAAAANRRLIVDLQSTITMRLPKGLDRPNEQILAQLRRWNRIVAELNQLEQVFPAPALPEAATRSIDAPFADLPGALRLAVDPVDPSVSFWQLDRWALEILGILSLGLIALTVFRRLIRLEWGEWLSLRTTLAWVLLGMIWWIWLTPGPLGPLIVAIAILRAGIHRRQMQHSVLVVEGASQS